VCGGNANFSNVTADGMPIFYWALKDWEGTVLLVLCRSSLFCKTGQSRSENKNSLLLRNMKRILSQFATTQHGVKSQLMVTVTPLLKSVFFPHRSIFYKFKYSLIRLSKSGQQRGTDLVSGDPHIVIQKWSPEQNWLWFR